MTIPESMAIVLPSVITLAIFGAGCLGYMIGRDKRETNADIVKPMLTSKAGITTSIGRAMIDQDTRQLTAVDDVSHTITFNDGSKITFDVKNPYVRNTEE